MAYHGSLKASFLKTGFDVIKDIASDVNLTFHTGGIRLVAPDPDMVTILRYEIPESVMTSHHLENETTLSIGINTTVFYKMVRSVTAQDIIEFEIHADTPLVLRMRIISPTKTSVTSLYSLPIPYIEMEFPEYDCETNCRLQTSVLQRILRDMSVLSKKVTVATMSSPDEGPKLVIATGGDTSTTSISLAASPDGLTWITDTGSLYHGRFFLKHIEQFLKPSFSKQISLFMTENQPLRLSYDDYKAEHGILLSVVVAPLPVI